jgi:hypothetical protein
MLKCDPHVFDSDHRHKDEVTSECCVPADRAGVGRADWLWVEPPDCIGFDHGDPLVGEGCVPRQRAPWQRWNLRRE